MSLDNYFDVIVQEHLYSSKRHLKFKLKKLFRDIDFTNKTVLDIGGGDGLFSFYAAAKGAREVICLEPEGNGSYGKMNTNFERVKQKLNLQNAHLIKKTFQDYDTKGKSFDIILMHNSINHLDEKACQYLRTDEHSRHKYLAMAKKIFEMSSDKAILIICDCSNKNFFPKIGRKNIFASNIDWEKHQSPETWAQIFEKSGFKKSKLSWNTPKQLGNIGNIFLGNRVTSYFIASHFRLELHKN